jgi:hypothetical protein
MPSNPMDGDSTSQPIQNSVKGGLSTALPFMPPQIKIPTECQSTMIRRKPMEDGGSASKCQWSLPPKDGSMINGLQGLRTKIPQYGSHLSVLLRSDGRMQVPL